MPALSPTMTSGNIGIWHKKIGDEIAPGDVLVEIETDKAQMDFECQEEGFLAAIIKEAGSKDIPVNQPIAVLVEKSDDVAAFAGFTIEDTAASSAPSAEREAVATKSLTTEAPLPPAVPAASPASVKVLLRRSLHRKIQLIWLKFKVLDLMAVLLKMISYRFHLLVKYSTTLRITDGIATIAATKPDTKPAAPVSTATQAVGTYTDIPLTNMRKVIAARLQQSKGTIPHYYLTSSIAMDKVLKLRQAFNQKADGKFKLSVNDFILKAAALSLKAVPEVNSGWTDTAIRRFNTVDISVAVSTPAGLITPIVKNADLKGLVNISNDVRDMATRARDNKLAPEEYQGGTFTISNLGMFGIHEFSAIINPPQSCILAVGGTEKTLIPNETQERGFNVANVMKVTLSCDHRVVDGAVGAQWLAKFKDYLENPLTMML